MIYVQLQITISVDKTNRLIALWVPLCKATGLVGNFFRLVEVELLSYKNYLSKILS